MRIARANVPVPEASCPCCGAVGRRSAPVLWPELIRAWELSPGEVAYIDRQQGTACTGCGSNLRSMALARGIMRAFRFQGPLSAFVDGPGRAFRVLEVNEAGNLTQFLARLPGHRLGRYPEVDLRRLPFPDATFDLVVHSDTLEHVEGPVAALRECRRVLRSDGACAFTVPIVVGRLTRGRDGLAPSYHNDSAERDPALLVRTEYGADVWTQVVQAGFGECAIVAQEYPAAMALLARP